MKVNLLEYTPNAEDVLIFTKNTRLQMRGSEYAEIRSWPYSKKLEELAYMADTIPSSWEFVDYIFSIEGVTRAFTHQFVRTRTGSYAQQSMRVTDMSGFDYRLPSSFVGKKETGRYQVYTRCMEMIREEYENLIDLGVPEEDARGVLPTNILTNIVAKFNLRTLSEIVRSRSGGRTQDEYQEVVKKMTDEVLRIHPWAEFFLFPKGRTYFDELEEKVAAEPMVRRDILKAIDKMRKT